MAPTDTTSSTELALRSQGAPAWRWKCRWPGYLKGCGSGTLVVALLASLWGCGSARPKTVLEGPSLKEVVWHSPVALVGREYIEADVSMLGVRAGQFELQVTPSCEHPDRATLVSRMSTVGVVRFFKATDGTSRTTMDLDRGRPIASELTVLDGDVVRQYAAVHHAGAVDTTYLRTGSSAVHKQAKTPSGEHALDMQSAFLLLRHWRAEPGERGYFYVLLGRNVWQVLVTYEGLGTLEDEDKPATRAHLLSGTAKRTDAEGVVHERTFSIWLGRDPARIPLVIEGDASFGKVSMRLSHRKFDRNRSSVCSTASLH